MRMAAFVLLTLVAAAGGGEPPAAEVGRVAWLQGCWQSASGGRTVEEQWMAPRGDSIVGMSRTVRDGKLVEYELVLIRHQGPAQVSAEFRASVVSDKRVVFENLQHDFPQRIGYERDASSLHAWVEGAEDGRERRIDFPYLRTSCPAS
jgi:hypothetical protein